jgi:hypothetical protein
MKNGIGFLLKVARARPGWKEAKFEVGNWNKGIWN